MMILKRKRKKKKRKLVVLKTNLFKRKIFLEKQKNYDLNKGFNFEFVFSKYFNS